MIARNGLSGLVLRVAFIGFAAIMFGCAPRAAASLKAMTPIAAAETQAG